MAAPATTINFISAIPAAEKIDGAWRFRDILRDHARFDLLCHTD